MTTGTSLTRHHNNLIEVCQSYLQLTKPRIIPLLLVTTAASMWLATGGRVDPLQLAIVLLGGTLAAASAQTLNCIYDRDIDYEMVRTRKRPLPSGRIQVQHALLFAVCLGAMSFSLLACLVNLTSAMLAMSGILLYMLVYTHWLKRHSSQNIVIGGAAGAIPPLVGWAAVTGGDVGIPALLLFAIIFVWTPPHFWALALMLEEDYASVNVPMLPVVAGAAVTARQIWYYTLLLVPMTLLLVYPLGVSGALYGICALGLGGQFLHKAWQLLQAPSDRQLARGTFKFSIFYMMLLCLAIVIDSLPVVRQGMGLLFGCH
ncbi:MAG: heme o synthase [Cyanobacteria bacterium J06641_5]